MSYDQEGILSQICAENLRVYDASPARLREDVSQESQVAHDYRGRLVYELLQNADDALSGGVSSEARVLFSLTDTDLWVANTGRPFTEADIRGLCGLGASSKTSSDGPRRASIGHKGLGFKSVLEITDTPEAYSEHVSFALGRQLAKASVQELWDSRARGPVKDVPAMRFPVPINGFHPRWKELQGQGYRTAFRFPLRFGPTAPDHQLLLEQLFSLPMSSVLFLKNLEEVAIMIESSRRQGNRQWLLERSRVLPAGETVRCAGLDGPGLYRVDLVDLDGDAHRYWVAHDSDVPIGKNRDGLAGPSWDGVELSEVSVATRDAEDPRLPANDRRIHVFLPTQEPATCSLLVNGAFVTDLSRKHVQVTHSDTDYNAHLLRRAASTFAEYLLPHLLRIRSAGYVLLALEQKSEIAGETATRFREELTKVLAGVPILPSMRGPQSLGSTVLPSPVLGDRGGEFAALLAPHSKWHTSAFPDAEYCVGHYAQICADYGSRALTPAESLIVLANNINPATARAIPEPGDRYYLDPVLEVCTTLWENSDAEDRATIEREARRQTIFPVRVGEDGSIDRIVLDKEIAFYPPRASSDELPLRKIKFLAHAICWGTLKRIEQSRVLEAPMKTWSALFDIKDFRFEEVMRAAVLPGLAKTGVDEELRDANMTFQSLAAICRLAGKTTKPDQPLPMGRLGSDRAFFNLSRLEVPCRGELNGEIVWAPAYQVYFGRDWVGDDSVEDLAQAMHAAGSKMDLHFLAPPSLFQPYSAALVQSDVASAAVDSDEGDEVDLEDDTDEALETTAEERWRNFFAWLGVSRGLRLVHFHDVNDDAGWISTKGLGTPRGWAFSGLEGVWEQYVAELQNQLRRDKRWEGTDHYLYKVHTLDHFSEIAELAERSDTGIAEALFVHLSRNWPIYSKQTQAEFALVGSGKYPSQRAKPPRAGSEELAQAGPDFWLYRLQHRAICPTSHGPRRPNQTWRRSEEMRRRLDGRGRRADDFLPVLKSVADLPEGAMRQFLDALRVRGELLPGSFTIGDAHALVSRIADLYSAKLDEQTLRAHIRPVYRALFELMVGSASDDGVSLRDAPVAARTPDGLRFLPAEDVIYASVSGSRERSGVQDKLCLFVLEAEASALRPLRDLFKMPLLESALEWTVMPGEPSLDDGGREQFYAGLQSLVRPLLARLGADRPDQAGSDRDLLQAFMSGVEPVDKLTLRCAFRGSDLGEVARTYHVEQPAARSRRKAPLTAFIVWEGQAWPPVPEDSQTLAMAIADALGVNTVETFLSFINANSTQRQQLLELAGAAGRLDEVEADLDRDENDADEQFEVVAPAPTVVSDGESSEPDSDSSATVQIPPPSPTTRKIPLHKFENLVLDGEILRVVSETTHTSDERRSTKHASTLKTGDEYVSSAAPRAASGTDLSELDRLGMRITIAFENRRLGVTSTAILPGKIPVDGCRNFIVDTSSPAMIDEAIKQSPLLDGVFNDLARSGISRLYPGFDVLSICDGQIDRMIELKSSGVDAQVQAMSWNEWKTAGGRLRSKFWLYLVGNLRSDLANALPFIRAVNDPFGTIASSEATSELRTRTVQLRVREFATADQLTLEVRRGEYAPDST